MQSCKRCKKVATTFTKKKWFTINTCRAFRRFILMLSHVPYSQTSIYCSYQYSENAKNLLCKIKKSKLWFDKTKKKLKKHAIRQI